MGMGNYEACEKNNNRGRFVYKPGGVLAFPTRNQPQTQMESSDWSDMALYVGT